MGGKFRFNGGFEQTFVGIGSGFAYLMAAFVIASYELAFQTFDTRLIIRSDRDFQLGQKRVLAIDPGFRTGCKVVCLDAQGNLIHNENIYPHPPVNKPGEAASKLRKMIEAYQIEAISIGNGTANAWDFHQFFP